MNSREMWNTFCALHPEHAGADYDAWAYGDAPDKLAALTLAGVKRATASAHALYAADGEAVPEAGVFSILLNSREEAVCILRTAAVNVVPFCDVSADFAAKEGEGDRSLTYWRQVHESFFSRELARAGLAFTMDMAVVCEEFEVVYP